IYARMVKLLYLLLCSNITMNKLLLITFLLLNSFGALAQVAPSTPTSIVDSSKAKPIVKPPDVQTGMSVSKSISDNLFAASGYSRFYNALKSADLVETFMSRGPITVFIPDDAAFAKLSKGKVDSLLNPLNLPLLIAFVTYHAIPGKLSFKKIAKQIDKKTQVATLTTLSGSKLKAKIDGGNLILIDDTGHQSIVTKTDMTQGNGYIHLIDIPLSPKNKLI
ncbi:MAG: fasciclin domain-containing protein, partial [Mucilaginibacter sp.]